MRRRLLVACLLLACVPTAGAAPLWHRAAAPPGIDLTLMTAEPDGTLVGVGSLFDQSLMASPPGRPFMRQAATGLPVGDVVSLGVVADGLRAATFDGVLYTSQDHGASWTPTGFLGGITGGSESFPDVPAWAIDPQQPARAIRMHDDGVVQWSLDGANTWLSAFPLPGADALDTQASSVVFSAGSAYLAVAGTLQRSSGPADPWHALPTPPPGPMQQGGGGTLWISGERGVFRSTDAGATWHGAGPRVSILVPSPYEADVAWSARGGRLRVTEDGGATWRTTDLPVAFDLLSVLFGAGSVVAPVPGAHAAVCVASTSALWCSHDAAPFTAALERFSATTAGLSAIAFDPLRADRALSLTRGLVWETTDALQSWHLFDPRPIEATSLVQTRTAAMVGTRNGVVARRRGASSWHRRRGPRGLTAVTAGDLSDTAYAFASGVLWRAGRDGRFVRLHPRILRPAGGPRIRRMRAIGAVGGRGRTLVAADRRHLLVSTDGGRTFAVAAPDGLAFAVVPDPRDPLRMVALARRGLYLTVDGGRTWRLTAAHLTLALTADPVRAGRWFAEWDGVLHVSTDGGAHWRDLSRPPAPHDILCCALFASHGRLWRFSAGFLAPSTTAVSWRRIGP